VSILGIGDRCGKTVSVTPSLFLGEGWGEGVAETNEKTIPFYF